MKACARARSDRGKRRRRLAIQGYDRPDQTHAERPGCRIGGAGMRRHRRRRPGQEKKPNIVVIMTDDVGWGDLGGYGGGVMRGAPTPHLDRLAAEGMRFVNYY